MSDTPATFLFADIAGFTALTEAHGDEQAVALVDAFCAAVDVDLPPGGTRVKSIGDAVMLRVPDPGDAILLGLRMTRDVLGANGTFGVRVGLPDSSSSSCQSARARRAIAVYSVSGPWAQR
jgi:adenylate cyclase